MDTLAPGITQAPPGRTLRGETADGPGSWSNAPSWHNSRPVGRAGRITPYLVVLVVALASVSCGDGIDDAVVIDISTTKSSTTTSASTATTAPSTSTSVTTTLIRSELPEVVDRLVDALMAGDAAAVARCYAEDGIWVDHGHPTVRELRQHSIEVTLSGAFRYLTLTEMTLLNASQAGDAILTEWTWSGTSSNHSRAAADQTAFTAGVEFLFTFDDDLIKTSEFSYDYGSVFN